VQREDMPSNNLIYSLKRDNRKDVLEFLSSELIEAISNSINNVSECVFINVPRRLEARLKYGFDHAKLLAKYISKHFSAQYYQPIISKVKKSQKKTQGRERIKNATFKLKNKAKDLSGKTVIIIDDIVTTGSSMGASATLIRALGAKKIIGAAISIAYKDTYIPVNRNDRFAVSG
jgi:competence protein ComFC